MREGAIPSREIFLIENKEHSLPIAVKALKEILIQYSNCMYDASPASP